MKSIQLFKCIHKNFRIQLFLRHFLAKDPLFSVEYLTTNKWLYSFSFPFNHTKNIYTNNSLTFTSTKSLWLLHRYPDKRPKYNIVHLSSSSPSTYFFFQLRILPKHAENNLLFVSWFRKMNFCNCFDTQE